MKSTLAGAEIVADTQRGRALARLPPGGAEGWVPEHFYAEVLAVLRRQSLIEKVLPEPKATVPLGAVRAVEPCEHGPTREAPLLPEAPAGKLAGIDAHHDRVGVELEQIGELLEVGIGTGHAFSEYEAGSLAFDPRRYASAVLPSRSRSFAVSSTASESTITENTTT